MSIGAGALSLRRIRVLRSPLETKLPWIVDKLRKQLVSPITIDESKEQSSGWCHPFTGEPDFGDVHRLVYENSFVFGMRTDTKKVPGTLFRLQLKAVYEELAKSAPADKQGRTRLSKKMRDAARDRIKTELLKRTLPNIRLVEIVWHLDSNEVWIMSSSTGVADEFERLFNETFGVPFVHVNPGTAAVEFDRILLGQEMNLNKLLEVLPTTIVKQRAHDQRDMEESAEAPF